MDSRTLVRRYRSQDLEHVERILSGYPSPTGRGWTKDVVDGMLSDSLQEQPDGVLVAEVDGEVVGFAIVVHREWFNIAYLDYIQVRREWIGKGIGHQLLEECIDWAKDKGARIIYTETGKDNERAISFYNRHNLQITGHIPDYYRKGLDAVILVKRLLQD